MEIIETGAFKDAIQLEHIYIPLSVKKIAANAFSGCKALTVHYAGGRYQRRIITDPFALPSGSCILNNSVYAGETIPLVYQKQGFDIRHGVVMKYSGKSTAVKTPDDVTSIKDNAFYGCSNLTDISIPDGVTEIGAQAFSRCVDLNNINIPNGVTSIGKSTFSYCEALADITIPNTVRSIGSCAFFCYEKLTGFIIPEGINGGGNYAFRFCTGLSSVQMSESIKVTGHYALLNCDSLTEIIYAGSPENWDKIYRKRSTTRRGKKRYINF